MNWVDLVIIFTVGLFIYEAYGHSFLLEALDLASFLLAFFLSFRYYNLAATFFTNQFNLPHGLSLVAGFMAVWFLAETIFGILTRILISKAPKLKIKVGKIFSIVPAFFRGLIFVSLFLVLLGTFPIQPTVKKAVLDSKIGNFILRNSYSLEQPLKQVFGGVTKDTLTFLTVEPKANEQVNLGFQTTQFKIDFESEEAMMVLVNHERTSRGLKALISDAKLQEVARFHSTDMFKRGYFSHYSPEGETVVDRADKFEVSYSVIGENLAYAPSLDLAHQGLMNSSGHKANILSPDFGKIGIGILDGGIYGKMFTQVFTD